MILQLCKKTTTSMGIYCKMLRRTSVILLTVNLFIACQKHSDTPESIPDDAIIKDLSVAVSKLPDVVYGNSLHKIEYSWTFDTNSAPENDLMVKVHFVNDDDRVVFQDDHRLPNQSRQRKYIRNILVPLIPRPQNIRMLVGVYHPDMPNRYFIPDGAGNYKNKVETQTFKVTPPLYLDDLPEARVNFGEGWYQKEYGPNHLDSWRWISNKAHCLLKGADRDLVLFIHGWVPEDVYDEPIELSLYLAGNSIGEYTELMSDFIIRLQITPEQILPNETEELVIQTNKSFQPAQLGNSHDTRDLSVMIKQFYFN
jgi:hypothetical protein